MLNGVTTVIYGSVPNYAAPERRTHLLSVFYTISIGAAAVSPPVAGFLSDLIGIANRLHSRVVSEMFGEDRPHVTRREIEILKLTAAGKDSTDIAIILDISPHTARDHLKSVRFKLDCATSAQAISKAINLGLLVV